MSFLPMGLDMVAAEPVTLPVTIVPGSKDMVPFIVHVRVLPVDDIKALRKEVPQPPKALRPGSKAADEFQDRAQRAWVKAFIKKAIAGWSGLTGANFDAINKGPTRIGGDPDARAAFYAKGADGKYPEIEFSLEAAEYLYMNTRPEDYGDRIWEEVWSVVKLEEEDTAAKKPG